MTLRMNDTYAHIYLRAPLLLGALSLFAVGCGGDDEMMQIPDPPVGPGTPNGIGDQPVLDTLIADWGTMTGYTLQAQKDTVDNNALAVAPIDDTGHFRMVLPGRSMLASYLTQTSTTVPRGANVSQCSGSYKTDPTPAGLFTVTMGVIPKLASNSFIHLLGETHPDTSTTVSHRVAYVYVDRNWNASGTYDCSGSATIFDLQYRTGWNIEISRDTTTGSGSSAKVIKTEIFTGPIPAGAQWFINK